MPILNYTTEVNISKTTAEIQDLLKKAGAKRILVDYENQEPVAIEFEVDWNGKRGAFRLPSRWQGVYKSLYKSNVSRKFKTEAQAKRVAWRIIKNWTEAQLAIIEAGSAELNEVFLPYMIDPRTNQTLFEEFKSGFLLGSGEDIIEGEIKQ